jgi:SAM-dependent methyltransferase
MDTRDSYSPEHFKPLFAAEDNHFWFLARNRCIAAATRLIPETNPVQDIIEHGCGTGFVLAELQRLYPSARVVGTDLYKEGLALARQRFAGALIQTDVLQCDFRESFDLIGLFDVLEHLDDDVRVLRAMRKQLRPGGRLLLTVPAHMVLWSDYDVTSGHRRRYTRQLLEARLAEGGFRVEFCTEFMCVLFPLMWLRRRLLRRATAIGMDSASNSERTKEELRVHPLLNRAMKFALRPDAWWIEHRRRLPFGTSLLALASRSTIGRQQS